MNEVIETAAERNSRVRKEQNISARLQKRETMSRERKHFLFINPGSEKINLLRYALRTGSPLPRFCDQGTFADKFVLKGQSVYFENLPVIDDEQKRQLVKKSYFNPSEPSTIESIHLLYRDKYANLTKRNVGDILKSLEVYQLNSQRRRPPKVLGKMSLRAPGILASDMFFPQGWDNVVCLTMMDCWSRYCRVYVIERKTKELTLKCFEKFFKEMLSLGHRPRVLLTDRGSEYIGLPNSPLFKKWKVSMEFSPTGAPIHIVEALQAQFMRRAQIYRTAQITENPGHVMHLISEQLNTQPRRQFDQKTPLQLLTLNKTQRGEANRYSDGHKQNIDAVKLEGLPVIFQGTTVRFLTWTRKEQVEGKKKGYAEKWSRSTHKVTKMRRTKENNDVFKFWISGQNMFFWRHELLKISGKVDTKVPKLFKLKEDMLYEDFYGMPKAQAKPQIKAFKAKPQAPKPKKKNKIIKLDLDEGDIITSKRKRKKKINYSQYY